MPAIGSVLAVVAGAWVVLLLAGPWLPAVPGALVYAAGSVICHQLPERSFHLGAYQLPVCARCFGIYAGAAAGTITVAWGLGQAARPLSTYGARAVLALAALPTAVTILLEWIGAWQTSNVARAAAGLLLGAGVAGVVVSSLAGSRWRTSDSGH